MKNLTFALVLGVCLSSMSYACSVGYCKSTTTVNGTTTSTCVPATTANTTTNKEGGLICKAADTVTVDSGYEGKPLH